MNTNVTPEPTGYPLDAVVLCIEAAYKAGKAEERERWQHMLLCAVRQGETLTRQGRRFAIKVDDNGWMFEFEG